MRNFFKIAITLFMSFVAAFGLFELFLRVTGPLHGQSIQGSKVILPTNRIYIYDNIHIRGADPHVVVSKNNIGFRGPNPPEHFQDWLTIVAVGGSTTECFYLSDGHDWPARLGARLSPDIDHLWVNNAGIDGHSTFGNLLLVENYLPQLKPKIVLLLAGANDIGLKDPNKDDDKIVRGGQMSSFLRTWAREIQNRSRAVGFLEFAYRTLYAKHRTAVQATGLDLIHQPRMTVSEHQFENIKREQEQVFLPAFQHRLEAIADLCRKNGIDLIFITHPALYGDVVDDVTGVDLGDRQAVNHLNGKMAWKLLELYNDRIRQTARSRHLFMMDLAKQLPKSSRYFCDYYHLSNEGADKVSELLAHDLKPYLLEHYARPVTPHHSLPSLSTKTIND